MDSENTLRIRTNVAAGDSYNINVKLKQTYSSFDILSLKIKQDDAYRYQSSDYGVLVGRVLANNGFGVPNAKISLFISVSNDISDVQALIYPFQNITTKNSDGIRYNILPAEAVNECHKAVGSFPSKTLVLDDKNVLEVYDTYYKFTTVTNNSGDYMIFGVPVGSYTLHMDLDISDCGTLSQRPRDFLNKGYTIDQFENANQFKGGTELDSLTQIITQNETVDIVSFWGDENSGNEIGISRKDVNVNYTFEPTCVFMGSIISDQESYGFTKRCKPTGNMGLMSELTTGGGTIEMIRKTVNNTVESYQIKGNELIDGNGIWCYQIPMNLDYVATDEYGNLVPTDDITKGIPTRACVRFRLSFNGDAGVTPAYQRGKVLVPHNPQSSDEVDYNFGSKTLDSSYKDLFMNNVYSIKSYIPRIQKKQRRRALYRRPTSHFSGIKECNFSATHNPFPYNNIRIRIPFSFRIACTIIKMVVRGVKRANRLKRWLGFGGHYSYLTDEMCPDLEGWFFAPGISNKTKRKWQRRLIARTYWDIYQEYYKTALDNDSDDDNTKTDGEEDTSDAENDTSFGDNAFNLDGNSGDGESNEGSTEQSDKYAILTSNCNYLIQCAEMNLAMEHKLIKFDFFNDWINGTVYLPRFSRTKAKRKRFKHGKIKTINVEKGCFTSVMKSSTSRYLFQTCAIPYKTRSGSGLHTLLDKSRPGCWRKKSACHASLQKFKIFGRNNGGLVNRTETMAGQTVYYLKPSEWRDGKQVILFATDIILLGSLNDCDKNGLPKIFSSLENTTYKMPENLVTTNLEADSFLYKLAGGMNMRLFEKDRNGYQLLMKGKPCSSLGYSSKKEARKFKWIKTASANNPFYEMYKANNDCFFNKDGVLGINGNDPDYFNQYIAWVNSQNKADGEDGEGAENPDLDGTDSFLLTEAAGIDWTMLGPMQSDNSADLLYTPGGHFLGLTCKKAKTTLKSCVNLQRICEAGTTMSERNDIPIGVNNNQEVYVETTPTGLVSDEEVFDKDFRSFFATLNHNRLATQKDPLTGMKEYVLNYMCPDGFDGEMSGAQDGWYNKYNGNVQRNSEDTGEYSEDYTFINRSPEIYNDDYHRFRFGLDKSETSDNSHFLVSDGANMYFPVYQNSFYFYFGLINGNTALDEFRKLYFADCGEYDYSQEEPYIEVNTDDDDFSVNVLLHNYDLPVSAMSVTQEGKLIRDVDTGLTETYQITGLTIGKYTFNLTDKRGNVYEEDFSVGYDTLTVLGGYETLLDYNTLYSCINSYDFNINDIPEGMTNSLNAMPLINRYAVEDTTDAAGNPIRVITCNNLTYGGIITLPASIEFRRTVKKLGTTDSDFTYEIVCVEALNVERSYSENYYTVENGITYTDFNNVTANTLVVSAWRPGNYDIYIHLNVYGEQQKIYLTTVFIDRANRNFDFYINGCEHLSYDDTLRYLPNGWWAENNLNLDRGNKWNGISEEKITDSLLQRNLSVEEGEENTISINTILTNDVIEESNIEEYTIGPGVVKLDEDGKYYFFNRDSVMSDSVLEDELEDSDLTDFTATKISLSEPKYLPNYFKEPSSAVTRYSAPYWYTQYNSDITSDESFQCASDFIGTLRHYSGSKYILEDPFDAKLTYKINFGTKDKDEEWTYRAGDITISIFNTNFSNTKDSENSFSNIFSRYEGFKISTNDDENYDYKVKVLIQNANAKNPTALIRISKVTTGDDISKFKVLKINTDGSIYVDIYLKYCDNFLFLQKGLFKDNKDLYKIYLYRLTSFNSLVFDGSNLNYLFYYSELEPSYMDDSFSGITTGGTVGPETNTVAQGIIDGTLLTAYKWDFKDEDEEDEDTESNVKAETINYDESEAPRRVKPRKYGDTLLFSGETLTQSQLLAKEKEYVFVINKNIPPIDGEIKITDEYLYYGYIEEVSGVKYVTLENDYSIQDNPELYVYKMASLPLYNSSRSLFLKAISLSWYLGNNGGKTLLLEGNGSYCHYNNTQEMPGELSMLISLDNSGLTSTQLGLKENTKTLFIGNDFTGKDMSVTYGDFIWRSSSDSSNDQGEIYSSTSTIASGINLKNSFTGKSIKFNVPYNSGGTLSVLAFNRNTSSNVLTNSYDIIINSENYYGDDFNVYLLGSGATELQTYLENSINSSSRDDIFMDLEFDEGKNVSSFKYGKDINELEHDVPIGGKAEVVQLSNNAIKICNSKNYYYWLTQTDWTKTTSISANSDTLRLEYAYHDGIEFVKLDSSKWTDTNLDRNNLYIHANRDECYELINSYDDCKQYEYIYTCDSSDSANTIFVGHKSVNIDESQFLYVEDSFEHNKYDYYGLMYQKTINDDVYKMFLGDFNSYRRKYASDKLDDKTYKIKNYSELQRALMDNASMFYNQFAATDADGNVIWPDDYLRINSLTISSFAANNTTTRSFTYEDLDDGERYGTIKVDYTGVKNPSSVYSDENPLNDVLLDGIAFMVETKDFSSCDDTKNLYEYITGNTKFDINQSSTIFYYFKFSNPSDFYVSTQSLGASDNDRYTDVKEATYVYKNDDFCTIYASYNSPSFGQSDSNRRKTLIKTISFEEFGAMFHDTDYTTAKADIVNETTTFLSDNKGVLEQNGVSSANYKSDRKTNKDLIDKYDEYNVLYEGLILAQGDSFIKEALNKGVKSLKNISDTFKQTSIPQIFRISLRAKYCTETYYPNNATKNGINLFPEYDSNRTVQNALMYTWKEYPKKTIKDVLPTFYEIYNPKNDKWDELDTTEYTMEEDGTIKNELIDINPLHDDYLIINNDDDGNFLSYELKIRYCYDYDIEIINDDVFSAIDEEAYTIDITSGEKSQEVRSKATGLHVKATIATSYLCTDPTDDLHGPYSADTSTSVKDVVLAYYGKDGSDVLSKEETNISGNEYQDTYTNKIIDMDVKFYINFGNGGVSETYAEITWGIPFGQQTDFYAANFVKDNDIDNNTGTSGLFGVDNIYDKNLDFKTKLQTILDKDGFIKVHL